jgi:signal transduction histidine kinase
MSEQELYVLRQRNLIYERILSAIVILNIAGLIYQLFILPSVPGVLMSVVANIGETSILGSCLILNRRGFSKLSKVISLSFLNLLVIIESITFPVRVGSFCFVPALILIANFIFDQRERSLRNFFILLSFSCGILIVVVDQGNYVMQSLTEENLRIAFVGSFLKSSIIFFSILYVNNKVNRRVENWLSEYARREKERSQYYENVNIELENFLNRTTHDLRSPLASIKGLVSRATYEITDPRSIAVFHKIDERIENLDVFSKDIIEYSKNELRDVMYERVDLLALFTEIIESLKYMASAHRIEFVVDMGLAGDVVVDKDRLKIVLSNLVSNAIKYNNPQQQKPFVKISARHTADQLLIAVEDNGLGIGEQYLEKIFNMFYRASETGQGSGLGLYIVRSAVTKMRGEISVESTEGYGSRFSLRLPRGISAG